MDVYRFTTPPSSNITGLTVNLQAAGISLLTARVTVLDAMGNAVASAVTTDPLSNDLTVSLENYQASTTYFVKVEGAGSNVFSAGAYVLRLSYVGDSYGNSFTFGSSYVNTESGSNDIPRVGVRLGYTSNAHSRHVCRRRANRQFRGRGLVSDHLTDLMDYAGTLTVGVVPIEPKGSARRWQCSTAWAWSCRR